MLSISTILLGALILLVVWFINDRFIEGKNLPPGPWRIPIFGTLLAMKFKKLEKPHKMLQTLCKEYGGIMTLKLGFLSQVVIDDPETVKEVLTSDNYIDRAQNPYILDRSWGKSYGLLWGNGEGWREVRRFSIRTLRDFGFGKQKTQEVLMEEEIKDLMEVLNETLKTNDEIEINHLFNLSVFNIIWCMMAGVRFSRDDTMLRNLLQRIAELVKTIAGSGTILMGFSSIRRLFSIFPGTGRTRLDVIANLQNEVKNILDKRRAEGYYKEEQRDFIDVFLYEIDKTPQEKPYAYCDQQFITTIFDIFVAGSDTTALTCEYTILFMLLYPDVQKKVQAEIDDVVGRGRFPTAADRTKMPYTEAMLLEVLRRGNVTPIVVRAPVKDVQIKNYKIKKGTFTVVNTSSVHMNPALWENPEEFHPERFLSPNNKIINSENLYIFGGGKRVCIGETLVRATMFTYIATLLQNYNFSVSPTHPKKPTLENPIFGFTLTPQPFVAVVTPRPY